MDTGLGRSSEMQSAGQSGRTTHPQCPARSARRPAARRRSRRRRAHRSLRSEKGRMGASTRQPHAEGRPRLFTARGVSRRRPRSQRRCGGQAEEAAHRHLVHEQVRAQHRVRQAQLCEQRLHLRGHGLEDTHQNSPSVMPACPQPFLPPGGRRMGRPASSRGPAALSTA